MAFEVPGAELFPKLVSREAFSPDLYNINVPGDGMTLRDVFKYAKGYPNPCANEVELQWVLENHDSPIAAPFYDGNAYLFFGEGKKNNLISYIRSKGGVLYKGMQSLPMRFNWRFDGRVVLSRSRNKQP